MKFFNLKRSIIHKFATDYKFPLGFYDLNLIQKKPMNKDSENNLKSETGSPKIVDKSYIKNLYSKPLMELVEMAHSEHKKHFKENTIQASRLLSIKTGGCPEDCSYCSQSARYQTDLQKEKLMDLSLVLQKAKEAKKDGATRLCIGAAWREVKDGKSFDKVLKMVSAVNELGLEVCCTLGMLTLEQAKKLKKAGLYAYNHNIDTSPEFYSKIITTRTYQERLKTLENVRQAGLTVCTGGILGMGESDDDRISFIHQLTLLKPAPESITVNALVPMKGTPLEKQTPISSLDIVRVIAVCRLLMPKSFVRLSAGRTNMKEGDQFLCFYSGANSLFLGDKLLTAENPALAKDKVMLEKSGLKLSTLKEENRPRA